MFYTSHRDDMHPDAALQLDRVLKTGAEMVLRRAADLDDDAHLPEAARDLMMRCDLDTLDLDLVGRWSMVRGTRDERAWRMALERIMETQKGGGRQQPFSWRAAVLHAGLAEVAIDDLQIIELYFSLALVPKGLAFPSEAAGGMLHGDGCRKEDQDGTERVLETLERWCGF